MIAAFVLLAAASSAAAQQGGIAQTSVSQPPIAVSNSPPAIVAIPSDPGIPRFVVIEQPPPPPLSARIVRAPQPRRAAQDYVTPEDYPASARAQRAQGRV